MDSKKQAQGIASLGRYGDTTLMHMRPDEVAQLTAISRANGGDITINPDTGMPEAFLGDFLGSLLPMAAGAAANYFVPGSGFMAKYATPFLAGATTKAIQGDTDLGSLVMGGLGGVGGAGLGRSIQNFGNPDLAGTAANVADDAALDQVTSKGLEAGTDMTKAYATSVPQMSGTQGISMYTPQGQVFNQGAVRTGGTLGPQGVTGYKPTSVYDRGLAPDFTAPTRTGAIGSPYPRFDAGGFEPTTAVEPQGFLTNATDNIKSGIQSITDTLGETAKKSSENYRKAFDRLSEEGIGSYLSEVGDGDKFIGGIKTALPFAGAGYEAYMKDMYRNMPTYEDSTAGMYDPTRRLDLSMDTGLRLLAQGGEVKKYQMGGNIMGNTNPSYNLGSPYNQYPQGGGPPPEYGIVDVGGNFVKTSDKPGKGLMSKTDYYEAYKFKDPDYTPEKQEDSSGGDFEARAGLQGAAGGIDPVVALQAAQGYADTQQSDLNQQGLGGLKKGGAIKYQQGGQTTAETNTAKVATPPPVGAMEMVLAKKQMEEQGIPAGINIEAIKKQAGMNEGGITQLAQATPDDGKMLNGNGDGVSDDIPAMIEGEQEAALSDGEFIVPARIVSELGNGSSDAGAQKLYEMIDRIQAVRKQTMGDGKQYAKDTNAERYLPA